MARVPNRVGVEWNTKQDNGSFTWDDVRTEILMDIRAELQKLNQLLGCHNFTSIPRVLRRISANTYKPKRKSKPRR